MTPITAEQFKKLHDNRYKMVKLIADWERSGAGAGMVSNHVGDNDDNDEGEPTEYEFIDGDDHKSFLREYPSHILYHWHLLHKYGILQKVRQQLVGGSSVDGTNAPNVDTTSKKRKHLPGSIDPSISDSGRITKIWSKLLTQSMDLLMLQEQQINMLYR